jgi:hypothetical protein
MAKRKNTPAAIKLKLWVKSAGRCEFKGCNKPVWYNGLTLSESNFSEVAHIIASSPDGPRGNEQSEELQIEYSNLMLLCKECHKEIDDDPEKYPADLLRRWKQEHEERIEIQTAYPEEINRSTVLTFTVNIGQRLVPINIEAVRNAMFPKYPTDHKGIKISKNDFDRDGSQEYWHSYAKDIQRRIRYYLEEGINEVQVKHLSVFAIAPQPLLMYLGKCIGDTIPADLYQSHRNMANTNHTWSWPDHPNIHTSYLVNQVRFVEGSSQVALILALSDSIKSDKYDSFVNDTFSIYEITISDPSPHFLKSRQQLENFSYEYRKLLNKIQATHGRNCKVFILPAVPAPIAVECGRVLLPTKDPEIWGCEYYPNEQGFRQVLKIN